MFLTFYRDFFFSSPEIASIFSLTIFSCCVSLSSSIFVCFYMASLICASRSRWPTFPTSLLSVFPWLLSLLFFSASLFLTLWVGSFRQSVCTVLWCLLCLGLFRSAGSLALLSNTQRSPAMAETLGMPTLAAAAKFMVRTGEEDKMRSLWYCWGWIQCLSCWLPMFALVDRRFLALVMAAAMGM